MTRTVVCTIFFYISCYSREFFLVRDHFFNVIALYSFNFFPQSSQRVILTVSNLYHHWNVHREASLEWVWRRKYRKKNLFVPFQFCLFSGYFCNHNIVEDFSLVIEFQYFPILLIYRHGLTSVYMRFWSLVMEDNVSTFTWGCYIRLR